MKSEALLRAVVGVLPAVVAAGLVAVVLRAEAAGGEQSGFLQWLRRDSESQKEFIRQERDPQRQGGKLRSARAETPPAPSLFISAPPSWVTVGSIYRYTPLLGTNLPGFVFRAELAPSGMVVSAGTGAISWTPSEAQAGSHPVRVAVCGAGITNRQEFTVTVARLLELGSSTIGTNGGSLGAGECMLRVPTGALQQATQLMLASPSTPPDLESQWGVRPCGRIYVPRHAGSERSKLGPLAVPGATLTLSVDPAALPPGTDAGMLRLCTYDPVLDVVLVADLPRQRPAPAGAAAVSAAVLFGSYYFVGVPVEWLAYEEFKAQGDGYTRVYYRSSLIGPNRAAAEAYATTVVQGIAEASDKAKGLGFAVPSSPTVWVGNFGWDAEGQYLAAWERIMLKHTLSPRTLLSAPAHEFFHAVQDEYYNLGLAGQTDWIAWTFWWSEASSTWFQSLFDPKMITDRIGGYASGYLRTPLGYGGREGAYAQASLLCYAEAKKPGYVREVFDGSCGLWTGVFSAMKKALPLDEHYRKYVLWALEKYGTPLWCDGWLVALEDGSGEVTDRFNAKGDLQVEKTQVVPLPVLGRETNVLEVVIRDTAGVAPYYANIYKVRSDHDTDAPRNATTKAVSVRFEAAGGVGRDIPFVLVRDAYGKIIAQHDLAGPGFLRVHNFGRGPTDTAAELTLVHASTDGSPAGERTWTIRVREFDPWVGPWRGAAGGSANVGSARLTRLEVNGQACDSYAEFDAWLRPALQKMLAENQKPDLGILDSAVGRIPVSLTCRYASNPPGRREGRFLPLVAQP